MITIRKAADRFHTDLGWLDSRHTFSFGHHYDPAFTGFRSLLVVNDDTVAAGGGFPPHAHADMEILSYVVTGALSHQDSMGNGSTIVPGDVQRMTAGTGVRHSEMNAHDGATRFLQIWLAPDRRGHPPAYEQKRFGDDEKRDRLRLVASGRKDRGDAVLLHQDVALYAGLLSPGAAVEHVIDAGRHAWVQVVRGDVTLNDAPLGAGDGAALSDERAARLVARAEAEVLVFDLA